MLLERMLLPITLDYGRPMLLNTAQCRNQRNQQNQKPRVFGSTHPTSSHTVGLARRSLSDYRLERWKALRANLKKVKLAGAAIGRNPTVSNLRLKNTVLHLVKLIEQRTSIRVLQEHKWPRPLAALRSRSEEHTSELQSPLNLV